MLWGKGNGIEQEFLCKMPSFVLSHLPLPFPSLGYNNSYYLLSASKPPSTSLHTRLPVNPNRRWALFSSSSGDRYWGLEGVRSPEWQSQEQNPDLWDSELVAITIVKSSHIHIFLALQCVPIYFICLVSTDGQDHPQLVLSSFSAAIPQNLARNLAKVSQGHFAIWTLLPFLIWG